jgi:hypothetical protein
MEKIDEVASEKKTTKRRNFLSLALAAVGGFALGATHVKKAEAASGDALLIGRDNAGDTETRLVSNVGPIGGGIALHIQNTADQGNGIVVESKGGALEGRSAGGTLPAFGVLGRSEAGNGVVGRAKGNWPGVQGESESGNGVHGTSEQGIGVGAIQLMGSLGSGANRKPVWAFVARPTRLTQQASKGRQTQPAGGPAAYSDAPIRRRVQAWTDTQPRVLEMHAASSGGQSHQTDQAYKACRKQLVERLGAW